MELNEPLMMTPVFCMYHYIGMKEARFTPAGHLVEWILVEKDQEREREFIDLRKKSTLALLFLVAQVCQHPLARTWYGRCGIPTCIHEDRDADRYGVRTRTCHKSVKYEFQFNGY